MSRRAETAPPGRTYPPWRRRAFASHGPPNRSNATRSSNETMSEEISTTIDEAAFGSEEMPRRSSLLKKIVLGAILTVVIAVECLVASTYVPSAAQTEEMARAAMVAAENPDQLSDLEEEQEDEMLADQVEVDLGEFTVTASQPMSNTALRIDFQLWGTVHEEEYDEFMERLDEKAHRFREQVIITIRSANVTDLSEPQLGLIKRTVLEKANAIFGRRYLRTVILDDFSFIEQ